MKVELQRKPWAPHASRHLPRAHVSILTRSLPFYRAFMGSYVHRVRYGYHFVESADSSIPTRFALTMWCGSHGTIQLSDQTAARLRKHYPPQRKRGGELFAVPPDRSFSCATCEGRAIGAGQTESRVLAGRMLVFSPHL